MEITPKMRKDKLTSILGKDFGNVLFALENDYYLLEMTWNEYKTLYVNGESNITILKQTAESFFGHIQHIMWENILIGLCKITDPITSSGKENLTIRRLGSYYSDADFKNKINKVVESTEFARDWRNRHIAHSDLSFKLDRIANPLKDATYEKVEDSISQLHLIINVVYQVKLNESIARLTMDPSNGVNSLLYHLKNALDYKRQMENNLLREDV